MELKIHQAKTNLPKIDVRKRKFHIDFRSKTYVMGVLNVTPDSFSDGGRFLDRAKAIEHAFEMFRDGADIIDIGGESTRPGAACVSINEELDRVIPVIEGIARDLKIPVSIDTRKSQVAQAALENGAALVNDISGLRYDPEMASVVADHDAMLIVMHMKGTPQDMQLNPSYKDVIKEIIESLKESVTKAKKAGLGEDNIIIDPGIGFGKTVEHNLEILRRLDEFKILGRPICIGTSRKSFIGKILGTDVEDRLTGTLATSMIAVMKGANILRVHDVKEVSQAARLVDTINNKNYAKIRC